MNKVLLVILSLHQMALVPIIFQFVLLLMLKRMIQHDFLPEAVVKGVTIPMANKMKQYKCFYKLHFH